MKILFKNVTVFLVTAIAIITMGACSDTDQASIPNGNTRAITEVSENVTTNTTWSGEIHLMKKIAVTNGATLTISPSTVIKGMPSTSTLDATALIITKGSKIMADGESGTIVMTAYNGTKGGWGGLVILGKAKINQTGTTYIEGIKENSIPGVDTSYGGTDDNDNSGVIRYVRVEYAGAAIAPANELNAFTFGGVGRGTTLEYCQAYHGADDAFEFFGGCVNANHLVSTATDDDAFDYDFGYTGHLQFALATIDASMTYSSDPNGIECDNDGISSSLLPITHPVLSNITVVGTSNGQVAGVATTDGSIATALKSGADFRRNCNFTLVNSILYGFPRGILKETTNTFTLENNVICAASYGSVNGINFSTVKDATGTFTPSTTNYGLTSYSDIGLTSPWDSYKDYTALVPIGDPAFSGTTSVSGLVATTYKGAVDPDGTNWFTATWIK